MKKPVVEKKKAKDDSVDTSQERSKSILRFPEKLKLEVSLLEFVVHLNFIHF